MKNKQCTNKSRSAQPIFTLLILLCSIIVPSTTVSAKAEEPYIYTTHQGNPFLPLWEYIPDAEPYVFEDPDNPGQYRVYMYGSHDMMVSGYCGWDLVTWSAPVEDLTQWRYDGVIFESLAGGVADVLYAPDVEEVVDQKTGKKTYYLYPNNQSGPRISQVAKSDRPDGPFKTINWANAEQTATSGPLAFDPAVLHDDDGRVYGYWGIRGSEACEMDPNMYGLKKGSEIISPFIPTGDSDFRFFEASSIRKINDTYVLVYARTGNSVASGEPFGSGFDQLGYAWSSPKSGGGPLGPFTFGGILVDAGGEAVPNNANSGFNAAMASNNTHGSLFEVDGQWYITYHRGNRSFARQTMVEPIQMDYDDSTGEVKFLPMPGRRQGPAAVTGGNTFLTNRMPAAEMTSMGFSLGGLDPYRKHSAGIACFMMGNISGGGTRPNVREASKSERGLAGYNKGINGLEMTDIRNNAVIGYKYFNFDNTAPADKQTNLEIGLQPLGQDATIEVYLRSPELANTQDLGKKIGEFTLTADMPQKYTTLSIPVPEVDDKSISGLQGIFFRFVAPTAGTKNLCELWDLQFSIENNWFEDSFENGLTYWTTNGDSQIQEGALVLPSEDSQAMVKHGKKWADYFFQSEIKSLDGTMNVRFRQTDDHNYYELTVSQDKLELYSILHGKKVLLQSADYSVGSGAFTLSVDAVGNVLSVRIGNTLALSVKNGDHEIGTVGFTAGRGSIASIDSILVGKSVYSPQNTYEPPRANRDSLTLNGQELPGFSTTSNTYFIEVPEGSPIPQLGATCEYSDVRVTVIQATQVPGSAIARFIDGDTIRNYFIKFTLPNDEIERTPQSWGGLSELPADWKYFNNSEAAKANIAFGDAEGLVFTAPGTVAREDYPSNPGTAQFPHIEMAEPLQGDWEFTAEFENISEDVSGGGGAYGGYGLGFMTPGGAYVKFMRMNNNSFQMAGTGQSEFNATDSGSAFSLRLTKVGNTLTGYRSLDGGATWTRHGGYVISDTFDNARIQIFATTNMGTKEFKVYAKGITLANLGSLSNIPEDQLDVEKVLPLVGTSMSIPKDSYRNDTARAAKAVEILNARADIKGLGVTCAVVPFGNFYKLTISKGLSVLTVDPFVVIELLRDWADLESAIGQADALSEYDYTLASWNKLTNALKEAKKLNGDSNSLAINNACIRLASALNAMEEIAEGEVISVVGVNNDGHTNAETVTIVVQEDVGLEAETITVLKDGKVATVFENASIYPVFPSPKLEDIKDKEADKQTETLDSENQESLASQDTANEANATGSENKESFANKEAGNEANATGSENQEPLANQETDNQATPSGSENQESLADKEEKTDLITTATLVQSAEGQYRASLDLTQPGLGDGSYRLVADLYGNKYSFNFISDRTLPVIDFDSRTGQVNVTDSNLETVLLNGLETTSSFTLSGWSAYTVTAIDKAGNEAVALLKRDRPKPDSSDSDRSSDRESESKKSLFGDSGAANSDIAVATPVSTQDATSAANKAIQAAGGNNAVTARFVNKSEITIEAIKAMSGAAQTAGKTLMVNADNIVNGVVLSRIRFDVSQATQGIKFGVQLSGNKVDARKALFEKHFSNSLAILNLEQKGSFGTRVEIAAKVNLSGFDKNNLVYYSYDTATNQYVRIKEPNHFVDSNGYLHFFTDLGGDIVISEGPLTKR
ncbi:family 43 glycosylhydrolase (plasmid) [Oscillospiraceae bacterium MB08-C2-2]|nr:family 43 glycosylhydrolase [Oscillospiraceae bacterium MB08-C2-2]